MVPPEKNQLLIQAVESLPDSLLITDKEGLVMFMNPSAERITEWRQEEAVGRNLGEVFKIKTEDAASVDSSVKQTIRSQALLIRKSGSETPIDYSASSLSSETGDVMGYVVIFRNITEYRALDDALRRSRKKYKQLVNSIDGIVWEADGQTHEFSFVSKNAEKLMGYPIDRWLTTPTFWKDSLHPEDREKMMEAHAASVARRQKYELEYRVLASDGRTVWVRDSVHAMVEAGPRLRLQGIMTDITESKFAEEQLKRLEKALEAIPVGVTITDAAGVIVFTNSAEAEMHGYSVQDVIHKEAAMFSPPEKRRGLSLQQLREFGPWQREGTNIRKDGSVFPIHLISDVVRTWDGEPSGLVTCSLDISEQKRAQESAKEAQAWKESIVESALDCIISMDEEGKILEFNRAAEKTFGYRSYEVIGGPMAEKIIPPSLRQRHYRSLQRYLATGETRVLDKRIEMMALRADGTEFPVELTITRIRGTEKPKFTAYIRDITERKWAEHEIRLLQTITVAVSQAEDLHQALHAVLRNLCEATTWVIGQAWVPRSDGTALECSPAWYSADARLEQFRKVSQTFVFPPGIGLPGRAWLIGEPVCIPDMNLDPNFSREVAAQQVGLKAGIAIPVLSNGDVIAIMEFFVYELRNQDQRFLEVASWVAAELGSVIRRKRVEAALRESEERYRLLFERNLAGVFRSTLDGQIVDCNESFARMLGFGSRAEILATKAWDLYLERGDRESFLLHLQQQKALANYEICLKRRDGSLFWGLGNVNLLPATSGSALIEGTLIDITDRKKAEERLAYQAYHDELTDLPNRTLYHDRLQTAIARSERFGTRLVIMFLDIDQFKLINDSLGHDVGDWLLGEVAKRLKEMIREADTLARSGGDEFMFLFNDIGRTEDAARLAQKILSVIAKPFHHENQELSVSASLGISIYPGDGLDPDTLMKNADNAGYRAKELGRNRFQFSSAALSERAFKRLSLEQSLRRAVERREFIVHFQPQVNIQKGTITGVEALLRWQHPERGLLTASEFVWLAEEIDMIGPIGEFALRASCSQMKQWHQQGFSDLRVSVNLSAKQFQSPHLVEMVEEVLQESGLEPSCLVLEITETVAMQDLYRTHSILQEFVKKGIRIALDDFGVGYSSLNYLKHFPIHIIKVDRSFICDLASQKKDLAFVRAIISIARSLDQSVMAEGVETTQQLAILRQLGCEEIQGELFSPAAAPEEVQRLFETGRYDFNES